MSITFYDEMLERFDAGEAPSVILALDQYFATTPEQAAIAELNSHPLKRQLLKDPFLYAASIRVKRAENPTMLDIAYDRDTAANSESADRAMLQATTELTFAMSLRHRRKVMARQLSLAWARRSRVCVIDCGRFREGERLAGRNLTHLTLVDRDRGLISALPSEIAKSAIVEAAAPLDFVRSAAADGEQFDLIYSLGDMGLRDHGEAQAFFASARECLASGGEIHVARLTDSARVRGWTGDLSTPTDLSDAALAIGLSISARYDDAGCMRYETFAR
jgi:hypothetical protein